MKYASVLKSHSQLPTFARAVSSLRRGPWPGSGASSSVDIELAAHLPLLPELAGQLAETSRQIEDAVTVVAGMRKEAIAMDAAVGDVMSLEQRPAAMLRAAACATTRAESPYADDGRCRGRRAV